LRSDQDVLTVQLLLPASRNQWKSAARSANPHHQFSLRIHPPDRLAMASNCSSQAALVRGSFARVTVRLLFST